MFNYIISSLILILFLYILVLRRRIKLLSKYYKDLKMDIEILRTKGLQRFRKEEVDKIN